MNADLNPVERMVLRRMIMGFLKKHLSSWQTWVGILGPVVAFLQPSLHALIVNDPKSTVAVIVGSLLAFFNSTAPKDKAQSNGNS